MSLNDALEIVMMSDTGRVRPHNEDSLAADAGLGIAVLADGMGGYKAGEVASALAVTQVFRETRDALVDLVPGQVDAETGLHYESLVLRDAVQSANHAVYTGSRDHDEYNGMGTTVVSALFSNNILHCAHVGDSRMYALRNDKLERLTVDHTVVQEFVDSGLYTEAEARASFNSNLVTRALGAEPRIAVDVIERETRPGDLYLICSDGLTDLLNENVIAKLLRARRPLEKTVGRLIQSANRRGGDDNISVILVKVHKEFSAGHAWQNKLLDWFDTDRT